MAHIEALPARTAGLFVKLVYWLARRRLGRAETARYHYTVAMTSTPMLMPTALVDSLRADLGVPALVELTAAIAWENHRARFNHAVGAKEEGFSDQTLFLLPLAGSNQPGDTAVIERPA